ncbi:MAG: hypothetical protein QOI60_333 [Actinomycetota bacterium]|nr:hypothetical protein [Actinomycetota bacterium]
MRNGKGSGRLMAFRIVAVIGAVLHAAPIVFLGASYTAGEMRIHVVHNAAGLAMFTAVIALGWILAAISPDRMVAPFQAATLAVVAVVVASVISADVQGGLLSGVVGLVLVVLHPDRPVLARIGRTGPLPLILAALAVVPAIGFALESASLQRNGMPMDPHVEMHHWTGMAAFAMTLVVVAVVAGLGGPNRRIVAMVGGLSAMFFGVMALVYAGYPGAPARAWAIACIAWGMLLAGDGYRMAREPGNEPIVMEGPA